MALQAASLKEKTIQEVEPMRKYHDTSLNVKGYLLICLILYIFLPLNRYRHMCQSLVCFVNQQTTRWLSDYETTRWLTDRT
jgi:hypothetical protein